MANESQTKEEITAVEPAAPNKETTLKLITTKRFAGPHPEGLKAKTSLSSATGKILFNNDLKVVVRGNSDKSGSDNAATSKSTDSISIKLPVNKEAQYAAYYMLAWDTLYSIGTDGYKQKFEALQRARTVAYAELGINPTPGKQPELTAQQREIYNEKVRPFAFRYFEYKLSFKQPGKKPVRSKTFRSLQRMDADSISQKLHAKAKVTSEKLAISIKPTK